MFWVIYEYICLPKRFEIRYTIYVVMFNFGQLDLVSIICSKDTNSKIIFKYILCTKNPGSYSNERNLFFFPSSSSKEPKTRKDKKL